MAQDKRKTQKMRGSRNCGFGNTQKHRGAGSRGGRGMAGSKKQRWTGVSKYLPGKFGRSGFKRHESTIKSYSTINAGELDSNISKWVQEEKARKTKDGFEIDLSTIKINKLLGAGRVENKYSVKVESCSRKAREKIEAVGGVVETAEKNLGENESGVSEADDKVSA